jgi:hypothetical protein
MPLDLDYVCPVSKFSYVISGILLIRLPVLQEDVRHGLRFGHPASQV